jgi:acetyl-CoA C-acetyltransferase
VTVHVLGGAQTDFAERAETSTDGLADLMRTAVLAALDDAEVEAADVGTAHVGNLAAELFTGQAHLGGLLASAVPGLAGSAISRHEAACASGSVALLAAIAGLEAGHHDLAVVVGVEAMRGVPAADAARYLGSAAWVGREAVAETFPWPAMFARLAETYADRYGLDHRHLGRIAELNHANARRNPLAQARAWDFPEGSFSDDDVSNPVVSGPLRKTDCGRITDGAAAVVLAGPDAAARWAARRGRRLGDVPRVLGWGLRTDRLLLEDKLAAPDPDGYVFPHLRGSIGDAMARAGIGDLSGIDLVELHDCFTITEYVTLEHLGLAPPGQAWKVIEDGTIDPGGALPVNPSGGLIGAGHPVGATGVRMLHDVARQVSGRSGDMQVAGARRGLTVNIGGSCTTAAAFVVGTGA